VRGGGLLRLEGREGGGEGDANLLAVVPPELACEVLEEKSNLDEVIEGDGPTA